MPQDPVLHERLLFAPHTLPVTADSIFDATQIHRTPHRGTPLVHSRTPPPLVSLSRPSQSRDCASSLTMARSSRGEDNCQENYTSTRNALDINGGDVFLVRALSSPAQNHSLLAGDGDNDSRALPHLTHCSTTAGPGTASVSAMSSSTMACPASFASPSSPTPTLPTASSILLTRTSPSLPLTGPTAVGILDTTDDLASLGLLPGQRVSPWRLVAQLGLPEHFVDSYPIGAGIDGLAECVVARILQTHIDHPSATAPGPVRSVSRTSGCSTPHHIYRADSALGHQAPRSLSSHHTGTSLLLSTPRGNNCLEKIKSPLPPLREPLAVRTASTTAIAIAVERLEAQALREDSWLPQGAAFASSIVSPSSLGGPSGRAGTDPPPCSPRNDNTAATSFDEESHKPGVRDEEKVEEDIIGPHMPFLPPPEGIHTRYHPRQPRQLQVQLQQQDRRQLIRIPVVSQYSLDDSLPDAEDEHGPTEMETRLGIGDADQKTSGILGDNLQKGSEGTYALEPSFLDLASSKITRAAESVTRGSSQSIYPPPRSTRSEPRAGNEENRGSSHSGNKGGHPLSWLLVDLPGRALEENAGGAYVFVDPESLQIVGDIVDGPASLSDQRDHQSLQEQDRVTTGTNPEGLDIARLAAALAVHRVQVGGNPFMPLAHPWGAQWQQHDGLSECRPPSPSLRLPRSLTPSIPGLGIGMGRNGREGFVNLGNSDYDWTGSGILQDGHWCGTGRLIYSHCQEEQRLRQMWPYGMRTPPGWSTGVRQRMGRGCFGPWSIEDEQRERENRENGVDASSWPIPYDADCLAETRPNRPSCTSGLRAAMRMRAERAWSNPTFPSQNTIPSGQGQGQGQGRGQGQNQRQARGRGDRLSGKRFVQKHCRRGWQFLKRTSKAIVNCVSIRPSSDKNNE